MTEPSSNTAASNATQMYDTIIIGAGMSGLAAGIRLAYYDQRVCILERHYTIGGLNSFYRIDGRDYDVGLHAVTNFTPPGTKRGPLAKIMRQLRLSWDDFNLSPQVGSKIAFPGVSLEFGNGTDILREEIRKTFPSQVAAFDKMMGELLEYEDLEGADPDFMAREFLAERFSDPLLIEMLLCPVMWYGNARENDMDFGQFCIMFRSIYMEGFARPYKGVRLILKNLVRRFRSLGGELKLRHGVSRIAVEDGRAVGVVLDNGTEIQGKRILSSAGRIETLRMCDDVSEVDPRQAGQLTFVETISILDRAPKEIGHDHTIVFYNDSEKFHWERPENEMCDVRTGVVCSPNNFNYADKGELKDGIVRITAIASFDQWTGLSDDDYRLEKLKWFDRVAESAVRFVPDYRRYAIASDMFTPKTIRRFTWHDNAAVYGAPDKQLDGSTHLENVFLCGTDQGYVGIIGAIMSGISQANRYCLRD